MKNILQNFKKKFFNLLHIVKKQISKTFLFIEKSPNLLTFALILITAFYAWQTYRLNNITTNLMLLSAEPNIELESENFLKEYRLKIDSGKFHFLLSNQGPVDLKNIRINSKYFIFLIDRNLKEYYIEGGISSLFPDTVISNLSPYQKVSIHFDYKGSLLYESGYFYLDSLENLIEVSVKDLNKYFHTTYLEISINYQRNLDGKFFSKKFYFLIFLPSEPKKTFLFPTTKDEIPTIPRKGAMLGYFGMENDKKKKDLYKFQPYIFQKIP